MLFCQGECIVSVPFTRQYSKGGKVEEFSGNTVSLCDRKSNSLPVTVQVNEKIHLIPGHYYRVPVSVRTYVGKDGAVDVSLNMPRDSTFSEYDPDPIIELK